MRTIGRNDHGAAVEDVQRRLRVMGYELAVDGAYLQRTCDAVKMFRQSEGLPPGDFVDQQAWAALVDASFALGDRMLYLRMPHFHGADVRSLQTILEVLGFVVGKSDGIFGAHTERALRDFQLSVGITDDGIAGNTTFDAIERLRHAWEGKEPTSAEGAQMGFARAAEALEKMEACFYGLDEIGRGVASRIANLARATFEGAHVMSADTLEAFPPSNMLMVGVTSVEVDGQDGIPHRVLRRFHVSPPHQHRVVFGKDNATSRHYRSARSRLFGCNGYRNGRALGAAPRRPSARRLLRLVLVAPSFRARSLHYAA